MTNGFANFIPLTVILMSAMDVPLDNKIPQIFEPKNCAIVISSAAENNPRFEVKQGTGSIRESEAWGFVEIQEEKCCEGCDKFEESTRASSRFPVD